MNFDALNVADCIVPDTGGGGGNGGNPVVDARCSDATFAASNPTICGTSAYLVIKPSVALVCKLGSINFSVFLYQNGIETQVTDGLVFTSSDNDLLAISVHTGAATGLASGEVNVGVTRNGLTAQAVITILAGDCGTPGQGCDTVQVKTSILIDDSKSVGLNFGGGYQTRLNFAKAAALDYSNTILQVSGSPKDGIKVWSFSDVPDVISSDFLTDTGEIADEINGVSQEQTKTDLGAILTAAVNDLIAASADEKVILLISDGEQTLNTNIQPILDTASVFKAAGGIIICIGLRASGAGYDLLSRIATGGFFLNAIANNAGDVLEELSYLKSILCAGECVSSTATVNTAELDYSDFLNWSVIAGQVNLIGDGFLDLLPGNGLYVDFMGGSAGTIRTIDTFALKAGHQYTISFSAAGNNRINALTQSLLVQIKNSSSVVPASQAVIFQHSVAPNWDDPFTTFSFTFTPEFDVSVNIIFQQLFDATFTGEWHGNLLDNVLFQDVTTLTTLFQDNFDSENPVTTTGSSYGDYCSSTEPGLQSQDPNPLPNIETGLPSTTTFTSTKTACVTCPAGSTNMSPSTTPLVPDSYSDTQPSTPQDTITAKFNVLTVVSSYSITNLIPPIMFVVPTKFTLQASVDGVNWSVIDSQSGIVWGGSDVTKSFTLATPGTYLYFRLVITQTIPEAGPLNDLLGLSLFGLAPSATQQICSTASATSFISQSDADSKATAAATAAAQVQLDCQSIFTSTQQYTATCGGGSLGTSVTQSGTATSFISQADADAKALAIAVALANAALTCTDSNNAQKITINDFTIATPYPSTKFVSGMAGVITKVTVSIKGLTHSSPEDVNLLLRSPDGTAVVLMSHCGAQNAVSNINLIFDDAGGALPLSTLIASGTYHPTKFLAPAVFPAPAPQPAYAVNLAAFIGLNPNGAWSLWVIDDAEEDSGQIANGFDLTITSA